MAQTIEVIAPPSLTLTAKVYNYGSATVVDTCASMVEGPSGVYTATTSTTLDSGTYRIVAFSGTESAAVYSVDLTASGVFQAYDYDPNSVAALAAVTPIAMVPTSQPDESTLTLVRGDAYDDVSNVQLSWTVTQITTGKTVGFTIRDKDDNILIDTDTAGVTAFGSGTVVYVLLASSATELLPVGQAKFDVEVEMDTDSYWTIARGNVQVNRDQTRRA